MDQRQVARSKREYAVADRLRNELQGLGVSVNDRLLTWDGPDGLRGSFTGSSGGKARATTSGKGSGGLESKLTCRATAVAANPAASELPRPPEQEVTRELPDLSSQAAAVLKHLELVCGGAELIPPRMKAAFESISAGIEPDEASLDALLAARA